MNSDYEDDFGIDEVNRRIALRNESILVLGDMIDHYRNTEGNGSQLPAILVRIVELLK